MLQGKLALITGASQGIGKAIATKFAENNADLFLTARDIKTLDSIATELENKFSVKVYTCSADLGESEASKQVVSEILKLKRPLDILVNNAGILKSNMLSMVSRSEIEAQFQINVFSVMQLCQLGSRLMIRNKSGSIINLSSIMGVQGASGVSVYSATKASVIGFTKSLSKELAPYNIRVNAISPGFINTDMTKVLSDDNYKTRIDSIAFKRPGSPLEVANTALFLASDLSTYITGQNIGVDGGMVL